VQQSTPTGLQYQPHESPPILFTRMLHLIGSGVSRGTGTGAGAGPVPLPVYRNRTGTGASAGAGAGAGPVPVPVSIRIPVRYELAARKRGMLAS